MNTRIKVKAKNLFELLRVLNKSDETLCTLSLDLDISKTTIKLLDNYSDDWDFSDSTETTEKTSCDNTQQGYTKRCLRRGQRLSRPRLP